MAFTTDDLDAVKRAIATGEMTIQLGDMRITYRTMNELMQAKQAIEAELASVAATPRAWPRHQLADFSDE